MKDFIKEFKAFISRGSVVDMAVAVVIGGAFTAIVNSLVKDIIMPVIGLLFGGLSFANLKYVITPATEEVAESAIYYGNFIQFVVNFLLVALVIFIIIKVLGKFKKKEEEKAPEAPAIPADVALLTEIRDLLKDQNADQK